MKVKIGQVWTRKSDGARGTVIWQHPTTRVVYMVVGSAEERYSPAALAEYWTLTEDVCDQCVENYDADQMTTVPGPFGGWMVLCPDCAREGPEPISRAAMPREV